MMGLSPNDFWSLTPREWGWLVDATAPQGLSQREAEVLATKYPDLAPGARPHLEAGRE